MSVEENVERWRGGGGGGGEITPIENNIMERDVILVYSQPLWLLVLILIEGVSSALFILVRPLR